jgi:olefin beta-lactone synthetase
MTQRPANIAHRLTEQAQARGAQLALISLAEGTETSLTFAELDALASAYARGLVSLGLAPGMRVVLMAPPSIDFFALVFAVFRAGGVLVLIDPGIDKRALLQCLTEVKLDAFIGVPLAHLARRLFRSVFRSSKLNVTVGASLSFGTVSTPQLLRLGQAAPHPFHHSIADEAAAILFTSGSTGVPKGAVYTHAMLGAQVDALVGHFSLRPGDVELCTFAPFAIFDPAIGVTAVLPDMDFRFPAKADPSHLVQSIERFQCTSLFGAPALVDNLARHCQAEKVTLTPLRRVLSAGAPLSADVVRRMQSCLEPGVQIFTPYGATEALPVASIGSHTLLNETAALTKEGAGICVGHPVHPAEVRVITLFDGPISTWSADLEVASGVIGEIAVRGPAVTRQYFLRPEQTALAKIVDGDTVWHRMGDVGYLDHEGRLWMCGRKGHRVIAKNETLFSVPVEEVFNQHQSVRRSALVGVGAPGRQTAVVLIEKHAHSRCPEDVLLEELRELGQRYAVTRAVKHFFVFPKSFPVDLRHNSKIAREKLVPWATEALRV